MKIIKDILRWIAVIPVSIIVSIIVAILGGKIIEMTMLSNNPEIFNKIKRWKIF